MMKKILAILCIVTLFASFVPTAYATEDGNTIIPLQNFENMNVGDSISTTASSGWKIQNMGNNGSAVIASDGTNQYIKYTPDSSKKPELLYNFNALEANTNVRLSFKTKFDSNSVTRRIAFRSNGIDRDYAYFHTSKVIRAGATAYGGVKDVDDYTYRADIWYDVTIDMNPQTGYVVFKVSDGESTFVTHGQNQPHTNGLNSIKFHSDNDSATGNCWYIDDVKLEKLDASVEQFDKKLIMINNDKFTYMTENQELVGTTTEKWTTSAKTEKGATVKILSDNGNKYSSITAGSSSYTEFKRTFTSFTKADINSIQLDFSIKFNDMNHNKLLYIKGSEDKAYITFNTDGNVYIGNAGEGYDRSRIPNFIYTTDKWYDFSFKFNTQTGLAHISVKDGDKTFETLAKDTYANDMFERIGFTVDNGMPVGTTTSFCVDNVHMQQIDTFNMDYVNISDVKYSAETLQVGTITASLTGQVYDDTEYTLYLAIYTKGQKELVNIDAVPVKAEGFNKTFTASITVPEDVNSYEVRAFLFDKNLTPVQTLGVLQ